MPITWLDILLLGVMLVSGLLAMIRGFMREILSITAWAAAAVATLLLYPRLLPIAKANISSDIVATGAVIGGVFLVTLLIVSIITVRISDMILDSRIGALDRTLGFLFGLGRGLIIVVVAFLFFAWLVPGSKQPDGVRNAKSLEVLNKTGEWLQALLPQDMDNYLSQWFKKRPKGDEDTPGCPAWAAFRFQFAGRHRLGAIDRLSAVRPHRHAPVDRCHKQRWDIGDAEPDAAETFDLDSTDRLREECGVFGIFGHPDAAAITALGLHALQHRGQEAAGIVSFDGKRFHSERRMGLVGDNFSRREVIDRLPGTTAVGHVRYSTTGETILRNVQPLFAELDGGGFAIGHNGNLTNGLTLRRQLVRDGAMMQSTTDTEVILHLVARAKRNRFVDRFIEGLRQLEGAYAFVGMTNKKLVGARDPLGIRPLVLGTLDGCPILASETCALDIIGAKYVRDVENGEVLVFDEDGAHSHKPFPPMAPRPCIFEYIYFARPDSIIGGRAVYEVRKAMGAQLAREAPADADVIVAVPDSGVPAAMGYSQQAGLPYEMGIIRNHYVGRTFIEPTQHIRQLGVRLKHSANRAVVAGKRIVLVDDSIVRGTTSLKIVQMMRDAGAKEVHFRISSPPITHPDYYGIDTPERDKLLAATHDLEGMRKFIGADSLAFLSVEGIYKAMGFEGRDPVRPQFTDHCFTGEYPTGLTDQTGQQSQPRQLSLLAEAG